MFLTYAELKRILYIGQAVLGFIFLGFAWFQFHIALTDSDAVLNFIVALTLLVAGFLCVLFGLDAFLLREDMDIWN